MQKALAAALHNHRRLSELAKSGAPAEGQPTPTPSPETTPSPATLEVAPPPEPQVSPEQLNQTVLESLDRDQECKYLAEQYRAASERHQQLQARLTGPEGLLRQIEVEKIRLALPEVSEDPLRSAETKDRLHELQVEHRLLELESRELRATGQDLNDQFTARAHQFREMALGPLREAAKQAEFNAAVERHYTDLKNAWPIAVTKAVETLGIPQDLIEDFQEEAKLAARAHEGVIADPAAFVESRGKRFMESRLKFHRSQSAEYGKQAAARAAQTGSGQGVVTQIEQPNSGPPDLRTLIADRGKAFRQSFVR